MQKIFAALSIVFLFAVMTAVSTVPTSANGPADRRPDGSVQVDTDGLMAVCMGDPNMATIGILNAPGHTPTLTIKQGNKTIAALSKEQLANLTIGLDKESHAIIRYQPTDTITSQYDFRWNIDMESDLFQKQLHLNPDKLAGRVRFLDGVLYGNNLSEEIVAFRSDSVQHDSFRRRIAEPAIAINIQPGQSLVFSGSANLKIPYSVDGYQISLHNLPDPSMANMNHFLYYFDALKDKLPRYEPVLVRKAAFSPKPIICQSIIFSRSRLN